MSIHFDHLAVAAEDKRQSATFLTNLLGLPDPSASGPFLSVTLDDGVRLDYAEPGIEFPSQHYALLVADDVFDHALERIKADGVPYSAGLTGRFERVVGFGERVKCGDCAQVSAFLGAVLDSHARSTSPRSHSSRTTGVVIGTVV